MRTITIPDVAPTTLNMVSTSNRPIIDYTLTRQLGPNFTLRYLSCEEEFSPEQGDLISYSDDTFPPFSQLLRSLHTAFHFHIPFALSPEVLWYAICHELAIHIKRNPLRYAGQFTSRPDEKTAISIQDDTLNYSPDSISLPNDWYHVLQRLNYALRQHLPPATHRTFLPPFSTLSPESEATLLVSLLDQASSYYQYEVISLCGIPAIRLEGTAQDWELLYNYTHNLSRLFPGLQPYFQNLLPILTNLTLAAHQEAFAEEELFWKSIYKLNQVSGGPYVTGWINAFFAHISTEQGFVPKQNYDWGALESMSWNGFKLNKFPAHLSLVPFQWRFFDQSISMAFFAGIIGNEYRDGFLTPRLGYGVVEMKE